MLYMPIGSATDPQPAWGGRIAMTTQTMSARRSGLSSQLPGTASPGPVASAQPAETAASFDTPVPLTHLVSWLAAGLVGWATIIAVTLWALSGPLTFLT